MTFAIVFAHESAGAPHMGGGSSWTVLSMVAFSLFLLAFAWSLLRPSKRSTSTTADIATERFAQGEIDADEFERILNDVDTDRR